MKCLHCGAEYAENKHIIEHFTTIKANKIIIENSYSCPICDGITSGTTIGYIDYWDKEEFEAV